MGTELFGGRMTTRLFIPETRKLMIRKDKYYASNGRDWLIVGPERKILRDEIRDIEKEITDKYLSVGPVDRRSGGGFISVEDYALQKYEIKDLFELLISRNKGSGLYGESAKYTKLLITMGIEVMYTKYPVKRNVVRRLDIDRLIETGLIIDNYYS